MSHERRSRRERSGDALVRNADPLDAGDANVDAPLAAARVVVVDDEPAIRAFVTKILERRGFDVTSFPTGEAFLKALRSLKGPDLLVTDVRLAGVPGTELARELRSQMPALPVVFMTGYAPERLTATGDFEPGTAFIAKPFASDELIRAVSELLAGPNLSGKDDQHG